MRPASFGLLALGLPVKFNPVQEGRGGMVKIITIHGTNAGRPNDHGDQWWQKGSLFQTRVQQLIAEPLEFEPFHWSGANSERQRRKAGARLAKRIASNSDPPIVVGHSHGGSVAAHALFYLRLKSRRHFAERLRALLTVGTPMLRFKSTPNPLAQLRPIAQLVLLVFLAYFIAYAIHHKWYGESGSYPYLIGVFAALIAALVFILRRGIARKAAFRSGVFSQALSGKYARLNHSIDEAVLALKAVRNFNTSFLTARNLRGGVRTLLYSAFLIAWIGGHLTLAIDGVSPHDRARALDPKTLFSFKPGLADDQNDMIVALEAGQTIPSFGRTVAASHLQLNSQFRRHMGAPGPQFSRAVVKRDYVVIDYATALAKADLTELRSYVAEAGRTASASYYCMRFTGPCDFFAGALYLTIEARQELLDAIDLLQYQYGSNLPYGGAKTVYAAPVAESWREIDGIPSFFREVEPAVADTAIFKFVEIGSERTIFEAALISGDIDLYSHSLLSGASLPPEGVNVYTVRNYPAIRRGDEIVLPRVEGTSHYLNCLSQELRENGEQNLFAEFATADTFMAEVINDAAFRYGAYCAHLKFNIGPFDFYRSVLGSIGAGFVDREIWRLMYDFLNNNYKRDLGLFGEAEYVAQSMLAMMAMLVLWIIPLIIVEFLAAAVAAIGMRVILAAQIKNAVYGIDVDGEAIADVASGLDFNEPDIGTLPPEVEEKISEHSLRYAEAALGKIREIVSMSAENRTSPMLTDLGASVTWQELIHTAYFDVPAFAEHFAQELARVGGLTLRAAAKSDIAST